MIAGRRRRALFVLLTILVVAAGSWMWHHLPDLMEVEGPFDVTGVAGEQVSGRDLDLTVTGARVAASVRVAPRPAIPAVGRWVVVDARIEARTSFAQPRAELLVGPNTYIPSDRFALTGLGSELVPGIGQRGSWLFDVVPDLLERRAPLTLRVWAGDGRLDSRLVVSIPAPDGRPGGGPLPVEPVEASV
ncbi:hypothetical protein ASG82_19445 [Mycobacterium sp. Soil538]|nr:hypothetical protein ASG82_19445 [Mycobacterium sp. Soil538]